MTETVALAFSGGLDTTVCVPLLREEYGYDEVIGVTVDVGQPESELAAAAETAETLGIDQHVVDAREAFASVAFDAVASQATYQGYPLGTALARPVIATEIRRVARQQGATALAHGCTGKGNDQLRFEAVWRDGPETVIAPVRELGLTREWEIEYAADRDLPVEAGEGGTLSIDTNLWSRSVEGGNYEDPGYPSDATVYDWTADPQSGTQDVEIEFEAGEPVAVDGEQLEPVALIERLNELAGSYGVGRTDTMEDRMLGLKVRENYEHPAATTLYAAHQGLESLVLTADERQFKRRVDDEWAQQAYQGLLDAPLTAALESFVQTTNARVTGTATVRLGDGGARVVARQSPHAVYSESAASFDTASVGDIEQADATGVAKYHGFQSRLAPDVGGDSATDVGGGSTNDVDGDSTTDNAVNESADEPTDGVGGGSGDDGTVDEPGDGETPEILPDG